MQSSATAVTGRMRTPQNGKAFAFFCHSRQIVGRVLIKATAWGMSIPPFVITGFVTLKWRVWERNVERESLHCIVDLNFNQHECLTPSLLESRFGDNVLEVSTGRDFGALVWG